MRWGCPVSLMRLLLQALNDARWPTMSSSFRARLRDVAHRTSPVRFRRWRGVIPPRRRRPPTGLPRGRHSSGGEIRPTGEPAMPSPRKRPASPNAPPAPNAEILTALGRIEALLTHRRPARPRDHRANPVASRTNSVANWRPSLDRTPCRRRGSSRSRGRGQCSRSIRCASSQL